MGVFLEDGRDEVTEFASDNDADSEDGDAPRDGDVALSLLGC